MSQEDSLQSKSAQLHVMAEPELLAAIDDYRFARRINSRSEVIRTLVRNGLAAVNDESKKGEATA